MLTEIRIENFRGFKDLSIAPLKRVNLIIGQNNNRKTALLGGFGAAACRPAASDVGNFPQWFRVTGSHAIEEFWKWTIYNKDRESQAIG